MSQINVGNILQYKIIMPNKKKDNITDPKSSDKARALRLRTLRNLLDLSRNDIDKRHSLPAGTLQNWEDARIGLTQQGARRVIQIYKKEGLNCTFTWLMFGAGDAPKITERFSIDLSAFSALGGEERSPVKDEEELAQISKELLLFRQAYPEYIDIVVPDDAMVPRFIAGEFVAGCRLFGKDIDKAMQLDCIVHLNDNEILLRNLRHGSRTGVYTLACTNPNTNIDKPFLYDVEVLSAAPIIWARRHKVS